MHNALLHIDLIPVFEYEPQVERDSTGAFFEFDVHRPEVAEFSAVAENLKPVDFCFVHFDGDGDR